MPDTYDVVVIGAGPTGENVVTARSRAAHRGHRRSELLGGDVLLGAHPEQARCGRSPPSPRPGTSRECATRLTPPAALTAATRSPATGEDGQASWLDGAHIDLFRGTWPPELGRCRSRRARGKLKPRHAVVICTGSTRRYRGTRAWPKRARGPAGKQPGATSRRRAARRRSAGGVVGCEMAAAWQALGAPVTTCSPGRRAAAPDGGIRRRPVAGGLGAAGVDVRRNVSVTAAQRDRPDGPVTLLLDDQSRLEADEVLVAACGAPAPATWDWTPSACGTARGLTLTTPAGVQGTDGGWLYAAGDVSHLALLTDMGSTRPASAATRSLKRARGSIRRSPRGPPAGRARRPSSPCPRLPRWAWRRRGAGGLRQRPGGRRRHRPGARRPVVRRRLRAGPGMVVYEDSKVIVGMTLAWPGSAS